MGFARCACMDLSRVVELEQEVVRMSPVYLLYPGWLWLLLLLPLIWWLGNRSPALGERAIRQPMIWLRMALLIVVVFALTDPRWRATSEEYVRIWLIDVSRSVEEEAILRAREFQVELQGNGPAPEKEIYLNFGGAVIPVETLG